VCRAGRRDSGIVRLYVRSSEEASELAKYAIWRLHATRAGVFYIDDAYGQGGAGLLEEELDRGGAELASQLTARHIGELAICGIATEFCVKQTVLDAMRYGWPVIVLTDLVRAVESQPGDGELAQAAMLEAGATMALSSAWLQHR
jgi:hypothetical protein